MTLRFWVSHLGFLLLFFFVGCNGQRCLPCKCTSKVRGCSSCFWDPFLVFCPNKFLPASLLPFFIGFLALACFLWFDFFANLWEVFEPMLFGLPIGPLSVLTCHSPHFLWGDQFHFHIPHCTSGLFKELGTCCTYIVVRFLSDHRPFLLEVINANDSGPFPFRPIWSWCESSFLWMQWHFVRFMQFVERWLNRL